MKFDCDKFIETIREYEFIWRKSHPDHKIRSKCDAAWKEIAEMFNLEDAKAAKLKWKNLVDYFAKVKKPRSDIKEEKWRYLKAMSFIEEEEPANRDILNSIHVPICSRAMSSLSGLPISIFHSREQVTEEIRAQKIRLGLNWAQVAAELGRSKEWTAAACLGQMQFNAREANKVISIFQLPEEAKTWLQSIPSKGTSTTPVNDPLLYRFQEVLSIYGPALKELIHEEFGDGIMSAIDFKIDMQREQGERVKIVWSGKFLPYKPF